MTKEEILRSLLGKSNITSDMTFITINYLTKSFPEESPDVLQGVVDEYNSMIILENERVNISQNSTFINIKFLKASYPTVSDNCLEIVANKYNSAIVFETIMMQKPITADNTYLFPEFLQSSYPDIPFECLQEISNKYNSAIVLEGLRANSEITSDTTIIAPEILAESYPALSEDALKEVCDKYNALIYFEEIKEKNGEITADTTTITYEHLKSTYPNLSDETLYNLRDRYNSLIILEEYKARGTIVADTTWITARSLKTSYPEMSWDALKDIAGKYNSEIVLKQLMERGITPETTWINRDELINSYPNVPIEYLREVADKFNGFLLTEIEKQQNIDTQESSPFNFKLHMGLSTYNLLNGIIGNIPVSLNIKNAAELSKKQLERMSNVSEVVIKDGDNTPVSGQQIKPYTRKDYMDVSDKLDDLLKDIPMPQNPREQVDVVNRICKKIAEHAIYNHYVISDEGKKNQELQKTCRNLYGGLMNGKCVCAGYADILRNALARRGIESKYIEGYPKKGDAGHAWNQVNINGVWFNVDLTWIAEEIRNSKEVINVLKTDEEFLDHAKYSRYRTKSEKKCDTSVEEAVKPRAFTGVHLLKDFVGNCARGASGIKLRLSEITGMSNRLRGMNKLIDRNNTHQHVDYTANEIN